MLGCTDCHAVYGTRGPVKREEFMMAAMVLGGSKWNQLCRHVWPHLLPSFFLLVAQQFVSMLLLLLHLGLLHLFF